MGARGSGRRQYSGRCTVETVLSIDVRRWAREGRLDTASPFNWRWTEDGREFRRIVVYPQAGSLFVISDAAGGKLGSYRIDLAQTPCQLGGARTWFICPATGCGRRAAILYGGATFACRHCYNLNYQSQRETAADRAGRRAEKLRDRFGWPGGILEGCCWRPKGMHEKTYQLLLARYEAAVDECLADARLRFGHNFLGSSR